MMEEDKSDVLDLLRQAMEFAMPDLRHYLRPVKKGKVVAVYASDGNYYCDVQPLRNDETVDEQEPVISKVEIPILWGGPDRGVVCPPVVGVHCDITYYDGDPNFPRVSNFRWHNMRAPKAELNEFIIQLEPGVSIHIDKEKQIVTLTPENVNTEAGKNWTVKAGDNAEIEAGTDARIDAGQNVVITAGMDATINAGNNATVQAGNEATMTAGSVASIIAPYIYLCGRLIGRPYSGTGRAYAEFEGDVVIRGNQEIRENSKVDGNTDVGGDSSIGGNSSVTGDSKVQGTSWAATREGGSCPHK